MKSYSPICFSLIILIFSCDSPKTTEESKVLEIDQEITIDEIQRAFKNGDYTIVELTRFYLDRIKALDSDGPKLNAVLTINPDALNIAVQLDVEMQNGELRGPLHGIPILLKDNIDTGDQMPCTAGARAMKDSYPSKDSPLVAQLRKAGAVILGKTNLSEWANFHSRSSSSGWSGLGGQTNNPYDLSRNPCGSSAGSGVAVAANLCVLAIGTETNGSIVCPANNNGIVGIKPTVGLISRTGIIPISFSQDTAGPMARTVTDAAICLGALTDSDSKDSKTLTADRVVYNDYTQFLKTGVIRGKRIGYFKKPLGDNVRMTKIMEEAVAYFDEHGATIIEIDEIIPRKARDHSFQVLLYEFKDGLNRYFQNMGSVTQVRDLEDLIQKTFADSIEMKYHDHELLKVAQEKGDLNSEEYIEALAGALKLSREEGIDKVMDVNKLDAIIAPTGGPAWKTDLTNGDNFGISSSSPAAIAGYPNITLPMGQIDGLPVGLSIFGRPWSEPMLLEIAYSYEQGTRHRMTPKYLDSSDSIFINK
ncbi:MAG: amidase [Bacteroidetes bacterium]|nr:amidase [Bacteroidota bacterium]